MIYPLNTLQLEFYKFDASCTIAGYLFSGYINPAAIVTEQYRQPTLCIPVTVILILMILVYTVLFVHSHNPFLL